MTTEEFSLWSHLFKERCDKERKQESDINIVDVKSASDPLLSQAAKTESGSESRSKTTKKNHNKISMDELSTTKTQNNTRPDTPIPSQSSSSSSSSSAEEFMAEMKKQNDWKVVKKRKSKEKQDVSDATE